LGFPDNVFIFENASSIGLSPERQLVMFFEDIRSERQLMEVVADRLSIRWLLGYDLHEPLPDHSSLTRILKSAMGLWCSNAFSRRWSRYCVEAGLSWGKKRYFDSTKVEANASVNGLLPRFVVEGHLGRLFEDKKTEKE
jgi:hypothetical protein